MNLFVDKGSVVRKIWGKSDTVLFIFAGASAEFALNKAVDWLYFTGRLPADPLGRLFSTVVYAQKIVFSEQETAEKWIDSITSIHSAVEKSRGSRIPAWAYRDVLFMLIHYSRASFELLERKMTDTEKEELYDVFRRFGLRMGLTELPVNYREWTIAREDHLVRDLENGFYTADLFKQYRKHLGMMRYKILIESQKLVAPVHVKDLLKMGKIQWLRPLIGIYKLSRKIKMDGFLKLLILPGNYKKEVRQLDLVPETSAR